LNCLIIVFGKVVTLDYSTGHQRYTKALQ